MGVRDTLEKIESMVAGAKNVPFTGRIMINDNDLVHYVEELRRDLPKELEKAEVIMKQRDEIIADAQREAERIRKRAREYATQITDENEIVVQAKEKAKVILQQTQQRENEIIARTQANATQLQDDADAYANQVFDQLIAHVSSTFQGVQQAESGLQQALSVLQQAKAQMSQQRPKQAAPAPAPQPEGQAPAESQD